MVAGHLQQKNGIYYMVLSYPDASGKRKTKWISTKLPIKGNKKRAENLLLETRHTFVPDEKPLENDELFSNYMLRWLEIVRPTVATTTFASYSVIVKSVIVPYFKKTKLTLRGLRAIDIQTFYTRQLKRVSARTVIHYHALLHRALKYAVKIDLIGTNPVDKVDRPKITPFVGSFYDGTELEKQKEMLERGRKLCMEGDRERYRRIREFARNRFFGVSWDNDLKIGFEFKGQFIIDPWMDQSGRFEQTDEEAVSRYGKDNMALFVITVSDHLALFELYFE